MKQETMNPGRDYAKTIWGNQSPDLYTRERVRRVIVAMKARGYDPKDIDLPVEKSEMAKFLKQYAD